MEAFNNLVLWAQTSNLEMWLQLFVSHLLIFLLVMGIRERRASEREHIKQSMPIKLWTDDHTPSAEEMAAVKDLGEKLEKAKQAQIQAKEDAEQLQILKDEALVIGAKFTNDPEIGGLLVRQHEDSELVQLSIIELEHWTPEHRGRVFRARNCRLVDGDTFEDPAAGEAYDRIQKRVALKRIKMADTEPGLSEVVEAQLDSMLDNLSAETGISRDRLTGHGVSSEESDFLAYLNELIGSEKWYNTNPKTRLIIENIGHYMHRKCSPSVRLSKMTLQHWLDTLADARDQAHFENGGAQAHAAASTPDKSATP